MSKSTRSRCSGWAQQGSNLRPLGEQHPVYQGAINPTDLAHRGRRVYQSPPRSTPFVDVKWTADLGRRAGIRAAELAVAAVLYLPVRWAYRDGGAR